MCWGVLETGQAAVLRERGEVEKKKAYMKTYKK